MSDTGSEKVIVMYKENATEEDKKNTEKAIVEQGGVIHKKMDIINGFNATLPKTFSASLKGHDHIEAIEEDKEVQPVARKIKAARWLQPRAGSAYTDTELHFVTGSSAKHKELVLWNTTNPDFAVSEKVPFTGESEILGKVNHEGNVHDIAVISPTLIATASSYGAMSIYRVDTEPGSNSPLELRESVTAHRYKSESAVCTALAVRFGASVDGEAAEIVSSGEDGRLSYVPIARPDELETYEVDSTVITGVCALSQAQVAITTRAGQVKLFDRRNPSDVSSVFVNPSTSAGLESIAVHPSQSFRIATGTETGSVLVWDIRNTRSPTSERFNIHKSNVWELQFHPSDSSKIISCSDDASIAITEWTESRPAAAGNARGGAQQEGHSVQRLSSIFNALSINCFDVCSFTRNNLIVAGSDSDNLLLEKLSANDFSLF